MGVCSPVTPKKSWPTPLPKRGTDHTMPLHSSWQKTQEPSSVIHIFQGDTCERSCLDASLHCCELPVVQMVRVAKLPDDLVLATIGNGPIVSKSLSALDESGQMTDFISEVSVFRVKIEVNVVQSLNHCCISFEGLKYIQSFTSELEGLILELCHHGGFHVEQRNFEKQYMFTLKLSFFFFCIGKKASHLSDTDRCCT